MTTSTKKPIRMNGQVSLDTEAAKMKDPNLFRYPATQTWTWDGGDAIVVLTGGFKRPVTYVVLRLGDVVKIYEARGLMHALEQAGEDPNSYEIVAPY